MKFLYAVTLSFSILAVISAAPLPPGAGDDGNRDARTPSPPPPTQQVTPRPEDSPSVPLPGRTGIHTDAVTKVSTMYYGDDRIPEHMGHLQRNQDKYPHNRDAMALSSNSALNRSNALKNIPPPTNHPVTGEERVRDEKMLASMHNPLHKTKTTVELLPKPESNIEGGYTSHLVDIVRKGGPDSKAKLRPNPGWLPLDPDQHRGHEAPAKLNSETKMPEADTKKAGKKTKAAEATRKEAQEQGYTPQAGTMALRYRQGKPDPKTTAPTKETKPAGESNLQPGHVLPPGHVWKPTDGSQSPSHAGAPAQPKDSDQRQPIRPQDHADYMKQLHEKEDEAAKQRETEAQGKDKVVHVHESANHKAFEEKFGPAKKGDGAGRSYEAPAELNSPKPDHKLGVLTLPSRPRPKE